MSDPVQDTRLQIQQNPDDKPTSNLTALFRQNCELTNAAVLLLGDVPSPGDIKSCETAEPPADATEAGLKQENETLNTLVKGLGGLDARRMY